MENNMMELGMDEMELVNGGIEFNVMKAIGGGAATLPELLPWPPLRETACWTDRSLSIPEENRIMEELSVA